MNRQPTIDEIDERSHKLICEFRDHLREFQERMRRDSPEHLEPDGTVDAHRVFEGWCFQKLAALQLYVEFYGGLLSEILDSRES